MVILLDGMLAVKNFRTTTLEFQDFSRTCTFFRTQHFNFRTFQGMYVTCKLYQVNYAANLKVDRISASFSVSALNVDKWALSADIRFRPKAVVPHLVHFRFRRAAVGKFCGCRK